MPSLCVRPCCTLSSLHLGRRAVGRGAHSPVLLLLCFCAAALGQAKPHFSVILLSPRRVPLTRVSELFPACTSVHA